MKKLIFLGVFTLLLSIYILCYECSATLDYLYLSEEKQVVDFYVDVIDAYGKPLDKCFVTIIHLSDDGPIRLSGSLIHRGDPLRVIIPRRRVATYEGRDVYASVNLLIDACTEDHQVGGRALTIDPANLKWPIDVESVQIRLAKINLSSVYSVAQSQIEQQFSPPPPGYMTTNYSYTPVLEYSIWTSIYAKTQHPIGSKVRVECKKRLYNAATGEIISPWFSEGCTEVTMDSGVISDEHTGEKKYTLYFEFKYIYKTEWVMTAPPLAYEIVYAADTSGDPRSLKRTSESWSGNLPGHPYYYITPQGYTREIAVSGGVNYIWSVSVSFSIGYPYAVSLGLGVSVSTTPAPQAKLIIRAGSWQQGYVIRTETPDGTYRKSYSNWSTG
ncbi:hypothetical protein KEJ43_01815 [Candidatus Bathyarchaeota archaeon]|nr:hypothetical protein [Candidatus Bathyarchaeota archaeon]